MELDFTPQIIAEKEKKTLNKPFRTPNGPKKFSVYVKNDKGNIVKVNFGDPNMEIKRDDPDRRKNFRARHNCDNPGPKTKARYWSCKMWESRKSVTDYLKSSSEDWDGQTFSDIDYLISAYPALAFVEEEITEQSEADCGCEHEEQVREASYYRDKKKKKYSKAAPEVNDHYFKTKEEAMKDAKKLGLEGIHTHKTEDGETLYMAGPNHEAFMKRHKEIVENKSK